MKRKLKKIENRKPLTECLCLVIALITESYKHTLNKETFANVNLTLNPFRDTGFYTFFPKVIQDKDSLIDIFTFPHPLEEKPYFSSESFLLSVVLKIQHHTWGLLIH